MPPGKPSFGSGTGPPKPTSPSTTTGPNTCKTTQTTTSLEDIIATPSNVMDTDSTKNFLTSKMLCQEGQPYTLTHLVSILFYITQMSSATPVPVITAIRAVAFILKKHITCEIADAAAQYLATTLADSLAESLTYWLVDHTIAALAPQVAEVHSSLTSTSEYGPEGRGYPGPLHKLARDECTEQEGGVSIAAERLKEAADALYASVTDCQNAIKVLTHPL
ncbi:hypothetical protein DFJ58DRAFT_725789 [Suillus subalutaceus]|uniref:uncharacterized protein n=1 Tax=Suillus subalutaceus TaxID=48586 RepID=UPI001B8707AB|nr:uncharacterized protein DFJ58DRAFT_725789 [Suillus subalutaceus]KAG1861096.1 hypothetical protein DFJ58DRAFT_725789 [Suillus subalutaceus]